MGEFSFAAAALKTPTRNGYNAQGVNLNFYRAVEPDSLIAIFPARFVILSFDCLYRANHLDRSKLNC